MFKSLKGSENEHEIPKITYNEFLKELKTACPVIGLNSTLFATHSLWRGSVSDQFANGVPDKSNIRVAGNQMSLRHILTIQFFSNSNYKPSIHKNKKVGYWQVDVNHHTTTSQFSIQHQPNTKNSSIDSSTRIF